LEEVAKTIAGLSVSYHCQRRKLVIARESTQSWIARVSLIRDSFDSHVYEGFVRAKQAEWDDYQLEVTAWMLNKYLNTY